MGGGDLNLKKSWHPNTMKNQERVWKAEQADAAEKNKLAELQREISDERDREELKRVGQMSGVLSAPDANKKLEWMYKTSGELLNREEYLLGRTIDKNFERADAEEKSALVGVQVHKNHVEHECIPFSIRSYHGIPMSDEQVDLQRKIMEDPLMAIRQREMETRRKLLENPVKLKEIHRLLRTDSDLSGKSKKAKEKKSKKNKKDKKSKKSSKNDANDLDAILAKKYRKIRKETTLDDQDDGNLDIDNFLALKYRQLSNELDKMSGKTSKSKKKSSKDNADRGEKLRDRQTEQDRHGRATNRDRGTNKRDYDDNSRRNRNHSRSPDHTRKERKYSPAKRNTRSRSVSATRRDGDLYNRRRDDRNNRERNRRSPSYDRNIRRRQRSEDRNDRHKRSPSKDKDRRNRRKPSQDRDRPARRSRSEDGNRRRRRSQSRSRSRSNNTRTKYQSSTSRRSPRSRSSQHDEKPTNKTQQSTRITADASKPSRSSSSSSSTSSSSSSSSKASSVDAHPPKPLYGLISADGKRIEIKNKYKPVEQKESEKVVTKKAIFQAKSQRVPLTEQEKERKLLEMQENAKLRVIECQQISERNKKEKMAEEDLSSQTFDKDYVNKEMRRAISNQFSVESRIKSNMNNIQRSGRTMEANFAKR